MDEPLTDELLKDLLCAPDPAVFATAHHLQDRNVPEYLQFLLEKHSLKRSQVIRDACLNETFGYQIFTGARNASRNKILQIVFAMHLSLRETNRLLQTAGHNQLYCKTKRDAIIVFCLNKGYSLQKTDEELYNFGEDTIC